MNEQVRNTFDRHPAYDAGADGQDGSQAPSQASKQAVNQAVNQRAKRARRVPETQGSDAPGPDAGPGPISTNARGRAAVLLSVLGVVLALVTLGVGYAVVRWASEPATWFVIVTAVGLVLLSALALAAGRVGGLATFVVISLLLPFATALSMFIAGSQRFEDGIDDFFSADAPTSTGPDVASEEEAPSPADEAVAFGEAGQANEFTVTISGLECSATLRRAAVNPAYGEDEGVPEFVNARAPEGKEFCVVESLWLNDSQAPGSVSGWNSFSGLVADDGTKFAAVTEDSELSTRLTAQAGYDGGVLNPGDAAEIRSVFTVTEAQEFTHAMVEQFDLETPEVWFSLS